MTVELGGGRTASTQERRLREAWAATRPSDAEIERARGRFGQRARPRWRPFRVVFIAAAQGFIVGLVSLAGASFVANRVLSAFDSRSNATAPRAALEAPRGPRRHVAAPAGSSPTDQVPLEGDTAGHTARELPRTTPSLIPSIASNREGPARSTPRAPASGTSRAGSSQDPPRAEPVAAGGPIGADPDGPWARVARALSESDLKRADAALEELVKSEDPTTRDAAALARAELFIAHGGGARFRETVVHLAASGSTPLIRRRAGELLTRFPSMQGTP